MQDFIIIVENQNLYLVDIGVCEVNFLVVIFLFFVSFVDIIYMLDGQFWGIFMDGCLYWVNLNIGIIILMIIILQGGFFFYISLVVD